MGRKAWRRGPKYISLEQTLRIIRFGTEAITGSTVWKLDYGRSGLVEMKFIKLSPNSLFFTILLPD
jgi:hypothetical protein